MADIVRDFLKGDVTENEFFGLPKENLISVKEYLEFLKERDNEFQRLIKEQADSIKENCDWVDRVGFDASQIEETGKYMLSWINLFARDDINLIVSNGNDRSIYTDLAKIPSVYLINKKARIHSDRQQDLIPIQNELHEIEEIGREFYDGKLYAKKSISGSFVVQDLPELGVELYCGTGEYCGKLICRSFDRKGMFYDVPVIKNKEKSEKVLSLVQIKN